MITPLKNRIFVIHNHVVLMTPFLRQVARHYYDAADNISKLCFIFPNRRSMVFFNKWIAGCVKDSPHPKPVIAPAALTMNDFFYRVSGAAATDRVNLLLELYDCYKALNSKAEPLDDFIFWGDVILSDFDDTDKYLADPKRLYTNVADFKEIQDTYSYLSPEQLEAIQHFISHFRKGGKLTVNLDAENPDVKERFLMIWNLLYPLYRNFNKTLEEKGMAYEGMAYREFAERLKTESAVDILADSFRDTEKFVFVGLNALNECEKTAMRKMRDAGIAEFCWDFSSTMLRDPMNRSSMFMSQNVIEFPQAFTLDDGPSDKAALAEGPAIHVLSVPSAVGQAKYLPEILQKIAAEKTGGGLSGVGNLDVPGADTAIVLPDEGLLIPLLNTIPSEIGNVNVTMGYPMSGSEVYALMNNVAALQLHIRKTKSGWSFYHKQVWSIFSSGLLNAVLDDDAKERIAKIKAEARYYIPQSDLSGIWPFDLIFKPVIADPKAADAGQIRNFCSYQLELLSEIGAKISGMEGMALETHFAKQYYLSVNRLKSQALAILPMTYVRLLQQLIGGISVPFKGEPLKGLQIMGPLETRSMDFTNLIVLSCNEGVFPRRSVSSSFIPPELRKGFGLPTYENQDAVWAYYFFRMIQRAENVWLLYDSRTDGLKSGEESRYIKQLTFQYKYPKMTREAVKYRIGMPSDETAIEKTAEDLDRIRTMTYSVSSLQRYLACPAQFYYGSVKKLQPESEVSESMDSSMVGSVYHDTMYALYLGGVALDPEFDMDRKNVQANVREPLKEITREYIDRLIAEKDSIIRPKVRALIRRQLNAEEVAGRNLVLENVINQYVLKTLEKDIELMREKKVDRFQIRGLELEKWWTFDGFKFVGYIDRMDSFEPGVVRIVDYKTGKVEDEDININKENAPAIAETLFGVDVKNRPSKALQLFLYDRYVEKDVRDEAVENVIYPVPKLFNSGILSSSECKEFDDLVTGKLKELFKELSAPEVGFRRTTDTAICGWCDFRKNCGR